MTWVKWNLVLVHLEIALVSVQDRCTVRARDTTWLEIVCMHPIVPLGDEAQVEDCFSPFEVRANLCAR